MTVWSDRNPVVVSTRREYRRRRTTFFLARNHKESGTEGEEKEPFKIDIGAVHDVEGPRFGCDLIENVDVMDFPVCDVDKRGNVAVKIQQCMHLDRGFVPAKPGPWE